MASAITVLVVDDHALFRAGLRALLEPEAMIEVVGAAGSGGEAMDRVQTLTPDVVVTDLRMPGMSGTEAVHRIAELGLDTGVVVLTAHAETKDLEQLMDAGISACLNKSDADRHLSDAILAAASDERWIPNRTREDTGNGESASPESDLSVLSPREQQVLRFTAEQYSAREIGERLGISPKTVDTYRKRLKDKLDIDHSRQLVRFALRTGILGTEQESTSEPAPP